MSIPHSIFLNDQLLPLANSTKLLGVMIDDMLSWEEHIPYLSKKIAKATFSLRILQKCTSPSILVTCYIAYILPLLRYGLVFWGNAPSAKRIFILQKKAVRLLSPSEKCKGYPSCRGKFKTLNLLTLPSLYIFDTIIYIKKNPHLVVKNSEVHSHDTRQKSSLHLPSGKSHHFRKSHLVQGIKLMNAVPKHIQDIGVLSKYKKALKQNLVDEELYAVCEFFL